MHEDGSGIVLKRMNFKTWDQTWQAKSFKCRGAFKDLGGVW